MNACSLRGSLHLTVPSCDTTIADIVGNGVVEEDSVLGHNSNVRPERDLCHLRPKDQKYPVLSDPFVLPGSTGDKLSRERVPPWLPHILAGWANHTISPNPPHS